MICEALQSTAATAVAAGNVRGAADTTVVAVSVVAVVVVTFAVAAAALVSSRKTIGDCTK